VRIAPHLLMLHGTLRHLSRESDCITDHGQIWTRSTLLSASLRMIFHSRSSLRTLQRVFILSDGCVPYSSSYHLYDVKCEEVQFIQAYGDHRRSSGDPRFPRTKYIIAAKQLSTTITKVALTSLRKRLSALYKYISACFLGYEVSHPP
jgi:hypothetical protein